MSNFICFTTIPPRFTNIDKIINHIKNNYIYQFDRIKIYIPKKYKRFPNAYDIPSNLINVSLVDIIICDKDWGPATKFIGPLLDKNIKNNDNIHIIDDDTLKDKNWLVISKKYLNKYNNSVIQLRVCSYMNKPINIKLNQIHGVSGFSFRKGVLNNHHFFYFFNNLPELYLFIDDDILTYFIYLYKIKLVMTNDIVKRIYLATNDGLVDQRGILNRKNIRINANKYLNYKYKLNLNISYLV